MDKFKNAMVNKSSNYPDIDWSDFNFPPLIRVFHFSLAELQPPYKPIVRNIYICYLIILVITLLSILNNIIQAATGYPGINVFYAVLNFLLFNMAQMYVFYRGYRGLCSE